MLHLKAFCKLYRDLSHHHHYYYNILLLLLIYYYYYYHRRSRNCCLSISSLVDATESSKVFLVTTPLITPLIHWARICYPAGITSLYFTSLGLTKAGFPRERTLSKMTNCCLWAYTDHWLGGCWSFVSWVKRGPSMETWLKWKQMYRLAHWCPLS